MAEKQSAVPSEGRTFTEDLFGDAVFCDISEEFTLPEYEPEIKKILRVTARVLPAGKYVGGGRAEFAGSVVYGLIYRGTEGETGCVSLSSDYEFAVPCNNGDREIAVFADTVADSVMCRPLAPRRLQFRTRLKSRVQMLSDSAVPPCDAPPLTEILRSTAPVCLRKRITGGEFEIGGDIKVQGRPLACDGTVSVTEMHCEQGEVYCRGELWARVTCEDGGLITYEKRIPFERRFDGDVDKSWLCRPIASCWSCEYTGDENGGEVSAVAEVEAECCAAFSVALARDAFVCGAPSVAEKSKTELTSCVDCGSVTVPVSGSRVLTGEEAGLDRVCAPWWEVAFENPERDGSGAAVRGNAVLHCILQGDGGECAPVKIEMPFRVRLEGVASGGGRLYGNLSGTLSSVRIKTEKGSVSAEGELSVSVIITEKATESTVCSVKTVPSEDEKTPFGVSVVYPQKGDSLWQIAKRRWVSPAELCRMNGLSAELCEDPDSEESLAGVRALTLKR